MLDHKAHAIFINLKVGVSLDHDVLLRFVLFIALQTCWATFKVNNNIRSTPASSELTLVLHQSHYAQTTNRNLHCKGERNGAQRTTKIGFGKTMMQALELLQLVKRHILGLSKIEQL